MQANGAAHGRLDAPWLRARRDEYRQSFDPRRDHRLRALRLARRLRPDVDAEYHRRAEPALLLWQPARHRAMEPRAAGGSAPAVRRARETRGRPDTLRRYVQRRLAIGGGANAGPCR